MRTVIDALARAPALLHARVGARSPLEIEFDAAALAFRAMPIPGDPAAVIAER